MFAAGVFAAVVVLVAGGAGNVISPPPLPFASARKSLHILDVMSCRRAVEMYGIME